MGSKQLKNFTLYLLFLFTFVSTCFAGLPPTSTKGTADANPVTTFNWVYPFLDVTHVGVTATIPAAAHTVPAANLNAYIDFTNGSDVTGDGSYDAPWKTVQKACTSLVGTATINTPVAVHLSGGNNDTDAAPITCLPNIYLLSDYPIQVSQPFTVTGGALNDSALFQNIVFSGAFSWTRNDATTITLQFRNAEFFSGPTFKQSGAGTASVIAYDSVTVNADYLLPRTGSFFFNNTTQGTTTFEDADNNAYYEMMGGYIDSAVSVSGGAALYLSGLQADTPFGYSLTGTTTANGTPLFQYDASSAPPAIAGAFTSNFISYSQHESYTPSVAGNWNSVPAEVKTALDDLASTGIYKSQAQNLVFASPNGSAGLMSPRSLVGADFTGAFTSGSVIFAGATGALSQDNAKFFWDDTNFRLGIGTAAPGFALDITTAANFQANANIGTFLDFTQIATPANPAASHDRLYFKNDDNAYKLNSAGVESELLPATLASGDVFIGSAGNIATAQALSGGATVTNAGVVTIGPPSSNTVTATQALSEAAGATTIDWSTGYIFSLTLNANDTISFSNLLSGQVIVVRITNTASNYTVAWPGTVKWASGTAPVQTVGATTDVITCFYDGTSPWCNSVQDMH